MVAEKAHHPAVTDIPGQTDSLNASGLADENAVERIRYAADLVSVIGSIGALVLSLFIWKRLGVVAGLLFGGVTIFACYTLSALINSYGDAVHIANEHIKAMRKLEEERNTLLSASEKTDDQKTEPQADAADDEEDSPAPAEPDPVDRDYAAEEPEPEEHDAEHESATDLPSEAYEYDVVNRIANFSKRTQYGVICPVCGKWQESDNNTCFRCSCVFSFDNERHGKNR